MRLYHFLQKSRKNSPINQEMILISHFLVYCLQITLGCQKRCRTTINKTSLQIQAATPMGTIRIHTEAQAHTLPLGISRLLF